MFDVSWLVDLDTTAVCEQVTATQADLRAAEWLAVAAQWAVLHGPDPDPDPDAHLDPRAVRHQVFRSFGGDGTPEVEEYAAAELGVLMGVGVYGAAILIRDAQDLQHRHPCLWAALAAGRGRVLKARKVVTLTHVAGLTRAQARFGDQAATPYLDTLPWASFLRLVDARIIEADPHAAQARQAAAAMDRFVATGQTNEHGLRTRVGAPYAPARHTVRPDSARTSRASEQAERARDRALVPAPAANELSAAAGLRTPVTPDNSGPAPTPPTLTSGTWPPGS